MSEDIVVTRAGRILELRFNRPDKRNAITVAMYAALADSLHSAAADDQIRVVTIIGSGGVFTAGNDLRDFQQARPAGTDQPVFRFIRELAGFPKPLVAGVEGVAVGIGTTLLLHCDLVVAAPGATFSLPFVDLGLVPEAGSSLLLPRLIGQQRAAKHLILGDPFDAETAFHYGLVTEVVTEGLEARVRAIADRLAAKPPEAVRLAKQLLRAQSGTVEARVKEESDLFASRLTSPEAAEAFAAFFEKRPPRFD